MSVWDLYFGWPSGGVWSNLLASLLWATPAGATAVWRARVHRHRARAERAHLLARVDALHDRHDTLTATVDAVRDHLTSPVLPARHDPEWWRRSMARHDEESP